MNIELLPKQTLVIDYEKYVAWPQFEVIGSNRIRGLWRAHFLKHALTADDLTCAAWRAPIPPDILRLLQSYPDCHAELIEMAQAVPEIFVDWASWNPAFTQLAATYWTYRSNGHVPEIEKKIEIWENLDPRDLLHYTRSDRSKSFLKTLGKISANQCYDYLIPRIREQWQIPEKRRLLRHMKRITNDTSWLLGLHPPLLDPGIHKLMLECPYLDEIHAGHIIIDIMTRREMRGYEVWPYRNRIHNWEQLMSAYDRFMIKINHVPQRFSAEPIPGRKNDKLHIVPITNRSSLEREAKNMRNCISSYLLQIYNRECFAYRLLEPERATVLVDRRSGRWTIAEAMIQANARQVTSTTWNLLMDWVMNAQN